MGDGSSAIPFLLNSAQDLILHYYKLISSRDKELKKLREDIDALKATAKDTLTLTNKSEERRVWLKQVRELILDVEDTLAYSLTQVAREKSANRIYRMCNKTKISLAHKVKDWRDTVKERRDEAKILFHNQPRATSNNSTTSTTWEKDRPRQEKVIPLKLEADTIILALIAPSNELKSFSIVGMPGLGKTVLAWRIHKDPRIIREYPTNIWVQVTQDFNKRTTCLKILEEATKTGDELSEMARRKELSAKTDGELRDMVRDRLKRGKFLIVFDDVWETGHWYEIEDLLPLENDGGRVLITSRITEVAQYATRRKPKALRFLNKKESWELLQLEVFGNLVDCPAELRATGEKIAQKCKGLPLAIVMMGGVLEDIRRKKSSGKELMEEWKKISEHGYHDQEEASEESETRKESRPREARKIISQIISLSYNSLSPDPLKDCFLYLGTFPEDSEIPVRKLTQLWIVEGFVPEEEGHKTLEDTAQEYLKNLINMNLLIIEKRKPCGEIKTCSVHDTIRDFCKKEGKKVDLFQEISYSEEKRSFEPAENNIQSRRICVHSRVKEFLSGDRDFKKVRSFLSFPNETFSLEKDQVPSITEFFTYLRVLDVNTAINFPRFPDNLTRLVLLKYVTLSSANFKVLPTDIYKLWNVQTLEVYTSSPTLRITASIWNMMNLKHFNTKASIILTKDKKGKCSDTLRTLHKLSPQSCTEKVFSKATKLAALGVLGNLEKLADPTSCFKNLEALDKLNLSHHLSPEEEDKNRKPFQVLPKLPPNLTILKLSGTYLEWKHMTTIGELQKLKVLKLKKNAFVGDLWEAAHVGFGSLVSLHISDTNLSLWTASDEAFLGLKDLVLKNCKKLKEVPVELVKRLELLYMYNVHAHAVSSAEEQEKKIQVERKQTKLYEFKLVIPESDVL